MKNALPMIKRAAGLLIILAMLAIAFTSPFRSVYEYDSDEGRNLLRAGLITDGYPLYTSIWNDQPPLFPSLLQLWLKLFGASAANGRLLALCFACALALAFYAVVKERWGRLCALCAGFLLLFSNSFMLLAVSIMIGLPALALGLVSLYCLRVYLRTGKQSLLLLSAVWMALSLQTKFFTALLIPAMVLELCLSGKGRRKSAASAAAWLAACAGLYFCVAMLYFQGSWELYYSQLFKPHLDSMTLPGPGFSLMLEMLHADLDIVLLALAGCFFAIRGREKELRFPLVWLICSLAVLLCYRPLWYHYYLLLSLPLAWLAVAALDRVRRKPSLSWTLGFALFACAMLPFKALWTVRSLIEPAAKVNAPAIAAARGCQWIYTNNPSIAFYAGVRVPPEIAVSVTKRQFTGEEDQRFFISVMERYRPCRVLLYDFLNDSPLVRAYLREHYLRQGNVPLILPSIPPKHFPLMTLLVQFGVRFDLVSDRQRIPPFFLRTEIKEPEQFGPAPATMEFFIRKGQ